MPQVTVKVAGGCPRCGNPDIVVPDDYGPDTVIRCSGCGFTARHEEFFDCVAPGDE